jgi:lysophospholipase L1-like esterase
VFQEIVVTGRPKVLLFGDSIRGSYQPLVTEMLSGEADVAAPAENGQFALYTLASLKRWLDALGRPDVVHWNNGLHDLARCVGRAPVQIPVEHYAANLRFILEKLRETGARVIWASTTKVRPPHPPRDPIFSWVDADVVEYNRAAAFLMREEGVPIDDLYAVIAEDPDRYLWEDGVHLSEAGKRRCAEAVAAVVRQELAKKR